MAPQHSAERLHSSLKAVRLCRVDSFPLRRHFSLKSHTSEVPVLQHLRHNRGIHRSLGSILPRLQLQQ